LGSASLARRTIPGEPISPDLLAQHVQYLPGGEVLLAAPPGHDAESAALVVELLTGPHANWREAGVTVFADCGVGEPGSPPHPVFAAADACLLVVRAEHIDPDHAAQRILALTGHRRCPRGIVLIGADHDYASAIGLPVLGTLPATRAGARALLLGRSAR